MNNADAAWSPFPWYLVRGTGLPFAWLSELGADALAWEIPDEEAWQAAVARGSERLGELVARPLFREAVFMSNPRLDTKLDRWLAGAGRKRDSNARKRERTLLRYAQRFCAKNDSTSFFGAVAAGRVDASQPLEAHPLAEVRRVYLTQWVAQALMDAAAAELAEAGVAAPADQRAAGVAIEADGSQVRYALGRHAQLVEDGRVDPSADAAARGAAGVTAPWTELPSGLTDPLAEVRARLADCPEHPVRDRWLARIDDVEAERLAFEEASYPARRERLVDIEAQLNEALGERPRRRAGSYYASRTALHEACDRTGEALHLPAGWTDRALSAVGPWLDLGLLNTVAERLTLRAWFDRAFDPGAKVPWRDVAARLRADRIGFEMAAPPAARELRRLGHAIRDDVREQLDAHLEAHGAATPATVDLARLRSSTEAARALIDEVAFGAVYANPDLMIAKDGDAITPILAEGHHAALLTQALVAPLTASDAISAETARWAERLCAPARPALVSSYQHSFVSVSWDVGEVALEVSGSAARPEERRASFAEIAVSALPEGPLRLTVPTYAGGEVEIAPLTRLMRIDRASPVFSVPLPDLGSFLGTGWRYPSQLPRVSWGDIVVHRRRWHVASKRWATAPTPRQAALRLRKLCGDSFPRFTFCSPASEPKPVLFDWANPLSVEKAIWQARRDAHLVFVEMLPGPGQLWLEGPSGLHTSELRTVLTRRLRAYPPAA